MIRNLLLLLFLASLTLSGSAWFLFGDGVGARTPVDDSTAVMSDARLDESQRPVPNVLEASQVERSVDLELIGHANIVGRVVGDGGTPLRDVALTLVEVQEGVPQPARESSCDEDGRFGVGVLACETVRLRVTHAEHARLELEVSPRPDDTVDLGDLVMSRAVHIAGRVEEQSGAAIGGATVHTADGRSTVAGNDGAFVLEGLAAGEHWLWAAADGYAPRPVPPIRIAEGRPATDIVLTMEEACTLTGTVTVLDERGGVGPPIEGVTVEARVHRVSARPGALPDLACWTRSVVAITDAAGRFALSPLPVGQVEIITKHPAYHDFGRRYDTTTSNASVVLTPAGGVTGQVVAAGTDEPVAIDRVTLLASLGEEEGPWRQVAEPWALDGEAATNGEFHVPAGTYRFLRVVVEGPDIAPVTSEPFRVHWKTKSFGPMTLEAHAGTPVECRAVDDTGHAVPGAEVRVIQIDVNQSEGARPTSGAVVRTGVPFARDSVLTGLSGNATSKPLAPGRYRVVLSRSGYFDGVSEEIDVADGAARSPVRVVMARAESIRGQLTNTGGGTLPALQVLAEREGAPADEDPTIANVASARFEFPRLASGGYVIRLVDAATRGVVYAEQPLTLVSGRPQRVEFDCAGFGSTVRGVYTLDGSPMPDAEVALGRDTRNPSWVGTTDRDGRFEFVGVAHGEFLLRARTEADQACYGVARIRVEPGKPTDANLHFTTAAVQGRVVDARGEPVTRAAVVFEQKVDGRPQVVAELRTDDDGRFQALGLPKVELFVSTEAKYHGNVDRHRHDLRFGDSSEPLELTLERTGDLVFHLKRRPGMAILSDVEIQELSATEGASGHKHGFAAGQRPQLVELTQGDHRFHVRTSDGFEATAEVRVVAGQTRTVIVEF